MPPPRPVTEARSGSLEPGRPSRARSANTRHPACRPHTPPADRMYATDVRVRQTDVRQHHRLMPPERGIINEHRTQQLHLSGLMHGSIQLLSTVTRHWSNHLSSWFQTISASVSTLNRFGTGQGRYAANLVRWHQASDPSCICGNPRQTVDHIVNHCPITRFSGGLWSLHQADEHAVSCLGTQSE